jgi:lipoate-protein ligase A
LESLQAIPELKTQYEALSEWGWLYGHTLEFSHKMDEYLSLGFFDFQFQVEDGLIKDLKIYTDCLYPQLTDELTALLKGQPYSGHSVTQAFQKLSLNLPDLEPGLKELQSWLCREIEV